MKSRALYSPEPHRGWLPWGALAPILALVFFVGPGIPVGVGMYRLGLFDQQGPVGFAGMAAYTLLMFTLVGGITWIWVHFVERRPLSTIGLSRPGGAKKFALGHLIGCISIVAVVFVTWLAGGYDLAAGAPAW